MVNLAMVAEFDVGVVKKDGLDAGKFSGPLQSGTVPHLGARLQEAGRAEPKLDA